jgi:hypothetical protein
MTVFTEPNFESYAHSTNTASNSSVLLKHVQFTCVCLSLFGIKNLCFVAYTEAITGRLLIFQVISIQN